MAWHQRECVHHVCHTLVRSDVCSGAAHCYHFESGAQHKVMFFLVHHALHSAVPCAIMFVKDVLATIQFLSCRYYYRVGDGTTFSDNISFRSLLDAGKIRPR